MRAIVPIGVTDSQEDGVRGTAHLQKSSNRKGVALEVSSQESCPSFDATVLGRGQHS